jgi:hypothetical protein
MREISPCSANCEPLRCVVLDAEADVKFHSFLIWAQDGDKWSACQVSNWGTVQSRSKSVACVMASYGWKIVMNSKKVIS